ncbi:MAG: DUF4250 domain-containing protein [Clostridiales bacterium]|nr:DUF4250 domain-containing protein [Clostridiales bacterium]MCC8099220.1 DUF4250 domain-containing protein [Clostridiales bacterium]
MSIPKDPVILLSYVNTLLRDRYPSLTELCKSECVEESALKAALAAIQYEYDATLNKFV